jgi:hypothetical protein
MVHAPETEVAVGMASPKTGKPPGASSLADILSSR